jgi:Holliday junction resolvase-like predicted endonuclease
MINPLVWKDGEKQAENYMKKHGFKIVKTNFSCVGVELDIVAILPKEVQKKNIKLKLKQQLKGCDRKEKKMLKISFKTRMKQVTDLLVITEVKARTSDRFGEGKEAVNEQKQHSIIRGARYLQSLPEFAKYQIRFDVASVDAGEISYIEDAF